MSPDLMLDQDFGFVADLDTGLEPIARSQRRTMANETLHELLMQVAVYEDAIRGETVLAGGLEFGGNGKLCRPLGVDIPENDERRVAAEFERHPLDAVGALPQQETSNLG